MDSEETIFCNQLILGSGPGGSVVFERLADAGLFPTIVDEGMAVDDNSFRESPAVSTFKNYRHGGISPILSSPIFAHGEAKVL